MLRNLRRAAGSFLRLFADHFKWMALGGLCALVAVAAAVGLLALSGWFISAAALAGLSATTAGMFNFFIPSIGVRLFAILRTGARYAERVVSHDATFRILESLRTWFYRHLEPLAPARLMQYRSGDILNRIVADIDALDNLYLRVLSPTAVALLITVLLACFLWIFDPVMATAALMFMLAAGILVPAAAAGFGAAAGRRLARQSARLRTRIVEGLQGLPELLVFGAHGRHLEAIRQNNRRVARQQLRMSHIRGASSALMTLLSGLAVITVLHLGVTLVNHGVLDGANLAMIGLAVLAAFEAVWPLPSAYQYLGRTREAGRRLVEIVDGVPAVTFPRHSAGRPQQFDLKFDRVSFRYRADAPPAVAGVEFEIPAGRQLAVIGETGAGKSTLVNLLVRFWDPTAGRILLGGRDIRTFSESDLRGFIAVVSQQAHMFNASLRDNLLLARPGATRRDLRAALAAARLLDFVDQLPDGLETWIGESGKLLSGGQLRRLAMARAILQDAPVWVLDEPTEGLDPVTARRMMAALRPLVAGRTVLLISHRAEDLRHADWIVMLESGRIAAQGSHAALLKKNARYAALQINGRNCHNT